MSTKVWIDKKGNALRLGFTHNGRQQISLGVSDNKIGNSFAELMAKTVAHDIETGQYDATKAKYRHPSIRKSRQKPQEQPDTISAVKLFHNFTAEIHEERNLELGTLARYKTTANSLHEKFGDRSAESIDTKAALAWIADAKKRVSGRILKSRLQQLSRCWERAGLDNVWAEFIKKTKNNPCKRQEPFTAAEMQTILKAFGTGKHVHYHDFLAFLINTACRPGEAVALKWRDVGENYTTAFIQQTITRGRINTKGTKTGKSRNVQITPALQVILRERFDRLKPNRNDYVFLAPRGGLIHDKQFRSIWTDVLEECDIDYRTPYNIRHSAISLALMNGANPVALAEQTGHSVAVLLSTYAHAIGSECLFIDIKGL